MSDSSSDQTPGRERPVFDSWGCIDIIVEGPSDPPRPLSPTERARLEAEREKIARWGPLLDNPKPKKDSAGEAGSES